MDGDRGPDLAVLLLRLRRVPKGDGRSVSGVLQPRHHLGVDPGNRITTQHDLAAGRLRLVRAGVAGEVPGEPAARRLRIDGIPYLLPPARAGVVDLPRAGRAAVPGDRVPLADLRVDARATCDG